MIIKIHTAGGGYDIILERGCIRNSGLMDTARKCLIVTDSGVPQKYSEYIAENCTEPVIATVSQGEEGKSMEQLSRLLSIMLDNGFTRSDCVIAAGGGVAGDLAGFTAAVYMRGIDFYNVPTTLLSQADSSIGGKTAVNLSGVKNIAGAFWQPKKVLIDPDTLDTLPERQFASGMAEIIKAGLIADRELFEFIERQTLTSEHGAASLLTDRETVMYILAAALKVKQRFVEEDERENGERRMLNFGHTIGHGIESVTGMLHGECVAAGMVPMCSDSLKHRLIPVLEYIGLPHETEADPGAIYDVVMKDKKKKDGMIAAVYVDEPGEGYIRMTSPEELRERIGQIAV